MSNAQEHASPVEPTPDPANMVSLAGDDSSRGELEVAQTAVDFLELLLPLQVDDAEAAQTLHDIGQLRLYPLDDAARALAALQAAHQRRPLLFTARGYRKAGLRARSNDDVLLALESEAHHAPTHAYRAAIETARGALLERGAGNLPAARQAYSAALAASPGELPALVALLELDLRDGDREAAIDRCRALSDAITDGRVKAEYLAWAARLAELVGRREAALAHAVQAGLHAPDSPSVRFLGERLLADAQPRELCARLEAQITDGSLPAVPGWFEIGAIARYVLGDLALAERAFQAVFELVTDPGDASRAAAHAELAEVWARTGRHAQSLAAEEQLVATEPGEDPLERALAWTRIGALREEHTDDLAGAAAAYGKAVEAVPAHLPALEGAGRSYGKLGDTDRLVAVHLAEAEQTTSPAERATALRRAGELLVADPARVEIGIKYLTDASLVAPAHAGIFLSLERALRRMRAWAELCELYERELQHTTEPRRRAWLYLQIGAIAADHLGDPRRAMAAYRAAAEIPGGAPDQALKCLAQLLDESGELAELEPVLAKLTTLTEDPVQVASLYERAAILKEQRGDVDGAVATYLTALEHAPSSHSIHASAGRAFGRAGRWDALHTLYERASRDGSAAERASYGYKMGVLLARRLGRIDEGVAQLERVRKESPGHTPTLATLAAIYAEHQRWAELRPILAELPRTRARLIRRASIAEALGQLDEALLLWEQAAGEGASVAKRARARLLARLGRWAELAESYEQLATAPGAAAEIARARYRAAELHLERTGDRARAAELLEVGLADEPDSIPLYLARMRSSGASEPGRAALVSRLIERVQDQALRAALHGQIISGEHSTDEERLVALGQLLALSPRDPIATLQLEQLLEERRQRAPLIALLRGVQRDPKVDDGVLSATSTRLGMLLEELGSSREATDAFELAASTTQAPVLALLALPRLYRTLGDEPRTRVALESLAAAMPTGTERATVLRRLAADQAAAGEREAAAATLEWALREDPRAFDALRELDRLVGASAPERLIDPLMRAWAGEPPGPQRLDIGMALAVRQLRTGRVAQARETLERVLADDPQHLRAHLLSAELAAQTSAWPAAATALAAVAAHASADPRMTLEALTRLATLQLEYLDDLDAAKRTAEQLRALHDGELPTLEISLAIAQRADAHVDVALLLGQLIEHPALDEARRAASQLALATVQEVHLGDVAGAIQTLGEIKLPAHRRDAASRLLDLGGKTGRWDLAASALEATLDRGGELDAAWEIAIRTRLANLLEGPLARAEAAVRQYERIVAIDPGNLPTLERLAELSAGSPDKAIEYHRALLAADPLRLVSYRALRTLFLGRGDEDGAFVVEALLESVGAADEEESYFYKQHRTRLRGTLDGTLTAEDRALLAPETSGAAFALLHVLAPALASVFPVDYAAYGVDGSAPGHTGSSLAVAERLARLFGVGAFRLHAVPSRLGPCVEPGQPPVLFVPRSLDEAPPREQAVVLAELLARVAFDSVAGDRCRASVISASLLEYFLWAACEVAVPAATAPHRGRAVYEDVKRRVGAASAGVPQPAFAQAAQRVLDENAIQGEAILSAMDRVACRAAIFGAQDPLLAIAALRQRAGATGSGFASLSPALRSILAFVVSAGHLALRRRLEIGVAA